VPVWEEPSPRGSDEPVRMFECRAFLKHVTEGSSLYPGKVMALPWQGLACQSMPTFVSR